jgi:hypothetical protein
MIARNPGNSFTNHAALLFCLQADPDNICKKKPSRIGAACEFHDRTDDSGRLSGSFFYGYVNFSEGVRVVVQAFRAFESSKIGAYRNGGEVFGQALIIADSAFKRIIRFHDDLLFVPVVADWWFFARCIPA